MIIYKITNKINGKSYIGQTKSSLANRWYYHKNGSRCRAMKAAIDKYGEDNFILEILANCNTQLELDTKEMEFIKNLNTISPHGYNLRPGGNGSSHTEETKKKISEKRKGKGVPHKEISKFKIGLANSKRQWKQESRDKISAFAKTVSRPCKESMKTALSLAQQKNKKPILCVENSQIYESVSQAARLLNLRKSSIFSVLAGSKKTVKGYSFKKV